jgi:lysophospholipase
MGRDDGESRRKIPEGMTFERWPARDGWALRRLRHLPATEPRGSLLFLGGRGDFLEKYLEALGHWHRIGWRIDGVDWRGQGGSGRMLDDPLICHLDSFDPLLDDLDAFIHEWRTETPSPHVAVAHSMGGHLLLRLLAERSAALDGAVLLAPMAGIVARPLPALAVRLLAAAAVAAGLRHRRVWRGDAGNVGGRMTSCPDRQADKIWWKAHKPEIASGAPSWGWLKAALASIRRLEAAPGLQAIATPLLILASERDPVIDLAALRRLAAHLPGAALEILPGSGHELLREADRYRLPVIERIDGFLERAVRS